MLESLATSLSRTLESSFWPPLVDRAILVLNHVMRGDPAAPQKLVAHAGKAVRVEWRAPAGPWPRPPSVRLGITPAGLFEGLPAGESDPAAPEAQASPDALLITIDLPAPLAAARMLAEGARPVTEIRGDTELAADIAWLTGRLRWDAEHDLAQVMGDTSARVIVTSAGAAFSALKSFVDAAGRRRDPAAADAGTATPR